MNEHHHFLGLGSNIDPKINLHRALDMLRQEVLVDAVSNIWVTKSIGEAGPDFLNAAARITSHLEALKLKMQVLRPIEDKLGRRRTRRKNAPRTIDLDILITDSQVWDEEVWEYAHKALPLAELLPDLTHPTTGERLDSVASRLLRAAPLGIRPTILKSTDF